MPPSKSMLHRMLIAGALGQSMSTISDFASCDDTEATLDCLKALGADFTVCRQTVKIGGCTPEKREKEVVLPCRESASTLRFCLPLCLLSDKDAMVRASSSLLARPLEPYRALCEKSGGHFDLSENELRFSGLLKPGDFTLPGFVSSQFTSGLLFALPLLDKDSRILLESPIVSKPYMEMTRYVLSLFGVYSSEKENILTIPGRQTYQSRQGLVPEPDASTAAFFGALNHLGGAVSWSAVPADSVQADKCFASIFDELENGKPTIDITNCPDLAPVLFVLAALKNGASFTGTRRLAFKESDRVRCMADEMKKCGIALSANEDTVSVPASKPAAPCVPLSSHNDHRVAMALSVLLTTVGGVLEGAEAVKKSAPDFYTLLSSLGIPVSVYS